MQFSCIMPAYNEGPRIASMLSAAVGCPDIDEIIVVDDGSIDNTWEIIQGFQDSRIVSIQLEQNQGKLAAFFVGISKAIGDYIIMVDADYSGFRSEYFTQLILPVRLGEVHSTSMRWGNSFILTHITKFDILSGTRVLPKSVFDDREYFFQSRGFGLEVKINEKMYEEKMTLLGMYFPTVYNPTKWIQLFWREPKEVLQAVPLWKILRHTWYFYRQQP